MAKIAYIGPPFSFSHDLLVKDFKQDQHVPCVSLSAVVDSVAKKECQIGVVPFYNTTRLSIEESQIAIVRNKNKIFVTDVKPLEVCHFLCGFGTLSEVQELRSKSVVFAQADKWISRNLPNARPSQYDSTSQAVESLISGKPRNAAAIGTQSAAKAHKVPILKKHIENKPNVTLFFVVEHQKPDPRGADHFLLCLPNASKGDMSKVEDEVSKCGCGISSNWSVALGRNHDPAYFFEVNGQYSSMGLHSATVKVRTRFPQCFMVGAYQKKCITHLLWAQNSKDQPEVQP